MTTRKIVGWAMHICGWLLWMVSAITWAYLDGHRPGAPDAQHAIAFIGHRGNFYVSPTDLWPLVAMPALAAVLFIVGGLVARRPLP